MYTIIMNKDKTLVASRRIDLYEGDNLVDKIQFLFPQTYKDIDLEKCIVRFNYIDLTGEECSEILVKDDELYKNKLRYRYSIDSNFTKLYGDIIFDISFSVESEEVLFHTEKHIISIIPHLGSIPPTEILPEDSAGKILKEVYELEERVKELEENGSGENEHFIANITAYDNKCTSDKSVQEIIEAYNNGKIISGKLNNLYPLELYDIDFRQNIVKFKGLNHIGGTIINDSYYIYTFKNGNNGTYELFDIKTENKTVVGAINELNSKIIQSDWNQHDETAPDYIKNRTHYEYEDNGEVIFEGENVFFEYGMDWAIFRFNGQFELNYDTEYLVQINDCIITIRPGSEIELEPQYHSTIGNSIYLSSYLLQIHYYAKNDFYIKISTMGLGTVLKKIDEKFIPDTIQRVSDTNKALENVVFMENDGVINFSEGGNFVIDDDGDGNITITSSKIKVGDIDQDVTITSMILNIIDDERQNITIIEQ